MPREKSILDYRRLGGGTCNSSLVAEVAWNVDCVVLGEMVAERPACMLVTFPVARNEFNAKAALARDTRDPGLDPFVVPAAVSDRQFTVKAEVIERDAILHFIPFRIDPGHGSASRIEVIVR